MEQQGAVLEEVDSDLMFELRRLIADYQGYGVGTVLVWWAFGRVRKAMGAEGNSIGGREFVQALRLLEVEGDVAVISLDGQRPTFRILNVWKPINGPFWGSPVPAASVKNASSSPRTEPSSGSPRSGSRWDGYGDRYSSFNYW